MRNEVTENGRVIFRMDAVSVDQNDPSLTMQERDDLRICFAKPYTEWRVINIRRNGSEKIHLRFSTEAECDAAMDEIQANADARARMYGGRA